MDNFNDCNDNQPKNDTEPKLTFITNKPIQEAQVKESE
jgi:hypothetical protein